MKTYQNRMGWITCTGLLFLLGCVTINIYFPAEKVESVADEIVEDIRGNGTQELQDKDQSLGPHQLFIAFFGAEAWADDTVVSIANPTIRKTKKEMRERFAKLLPYYREGRIKEKDNGFLALDKTDGLGLKEKRDLKNLVELENKSRHFLYAEVAKAMKIDPSQIDKIAAIFAEKWQESAP